MNNISRKEAIAQELKRRGVDTSSLSASVMPPSPPLSQKDRIAQELKRRGVNLETVSQPSLGQEAASLAKGAFSGLAGGALDTAALIYNLPAMLQNFQSKQVSEFQQKHPELAKQLESHYGTPVEAPSELPLIPSATEGIEQGIDTLTGGYTNVPQGHLYEGAKFAGSLGSLGGSGAAAGKLGLKSLEKAGKALGISSPAEFIPAVTTGAVMSAAEEPLGPLGGLVAGAGAGTLTTKGVKGLEKIGEGIKGTLSGKGPTLGEMTIGKALSLRGEPSSAIEHITKKEGYELPFNVRLQSPIANFLANVGLNTIFVSKEYNDIIRKAPKKMVDSIVKRIDEIHPENIGSKAASSDYENLLKKQQEEVREHSTYLYNTANSFIKPGEKVNIEPLIKSIKELKDEITAPDPSESMKFVLGKINRIADKLGILKDIKNIKPPSGFTQEQWEDPELYKKVLKALEKNKNHEASLYDLTQQRTAWLQDMDYGKVSGIKKRLGKALRGLTDSIKSTDNKEFLNHWDAARTYFRIESANRVKSDLARALTEGTVPKEAYDFMGDPEKINQLQRIIGNSSAATKIFNSLKRAKLNDVLVDKIVNADGSLSHANFVNLFSKGNKNQELLKTLLGNKSYNDLKEISEISNIYTKAGKEFANPSGTAVRLQDQARITALIGSIFTGGMGALPIGASIGTPYVLSKLLSNPRYTDAAVRYSMAAKEGQLKDANYFQNRMKTIFHDTLRRAAPQEINEQMQKNQ